jgi:formate dehydrogenase beta subunit
MSLIAFSIDGQTVKAEASATILEAARKAGIYIPSLCHHPDLPKMAGLLPAAVVWQGQLRLENHPDRSSQASGCGLCLVEIQGEAEPKPACSTQVCAGLAVTTNSERLRRLRQEKLAPFLAKHPHACLTCAQAAGCSRTQCSSNVPEEERCCPKFGHCEFQKIVEYVGVAASVPRWKPTSLPILDGPLFERNYNLCIGCTRCLRACQDLRGVAALGFVFDQEGQVAVGSLAPDLAEAGCKFCTACVAVCPTGALSDKGISPARFKEDLVPCRAACPAGLDVPGYLRAIKAGRTSEALAIIQNKVPFPGVLGRVCFRPCEEACRRSSLGEPIAICTLKRYAADKGKDGRQIRPARPETGKRVAIVGAGPAGLAAAFYLRQLGHQVVVFDQADQPGGMMRQAIPAYRLPEAVVEAEIQDILDLGVELRLGASPKAIELKGYDACFLALGAQQSRKLNLEGAEARGVLWGLDFLKTVRQGRPVSLVGRVIVVGGGNVAIDVALTARRLGGQEVSLVCLERREEMPAHAWEIAQAEEEGVKIINSLGPRRILSQDGQVTGLELRACTAVFDSQGRFSPSYDDCRLTTMAAETIILAVGQAVETSLLKQLGVETRAGLAAVNEDSLATNLPGVFAGGDVARVAGSIIQAIADGRKVAASIDRYLGGSGEIDLDLVELGPPDPKIGRDEGFALWPRRAQLVRPLSQRRGFEEINLGYDDYSAQAEAARCLQCDLRLFIASPPLPPERIKPLDSQALAEVPETEGAVILYGQDKEVLAIIGVANLRRALQERLEGSSKARFFEAHPDKMYSKAESELIQAYLQRHGKMPPGDGVASAGGDLDDLF